MIDDGAIVAGWIAPHGVVPDMPVDRLSLVGPTDSAMKTSAERIMRLNPECVVLVTPHGFRAADANTVSLCRRNWMDLAVWYPWRSDRMEIDGDRDLAHQILTVSVEQGLPAVGLIYGATSDPSYPMDWAITAPMRYLQEAGYIGSLVPITFSGLPFRSEWSFGQAVGQAIQRSGKRVAVIASSDLSHVHSAEGPYGYKPIAPEFDRTIEAAVRDDNVRSLLDLNPAWVEEAAQDGLRSILILGGALEGRELHPEVLAYDVLVYFGMLTALFSREES